MMHLDIPYAYLVSDAVRSLGLDPARTLFGNTFEAYAFSLMIFVAASIVFAIAQHIIIVQLERLSERTTTDADDTLINIVKSIRPSFYLFLSFYLAALPLALPPVAETILTAVLLIWVAVQVVLSLHRLIDYLILRRQRRESEESAASAMRYLGTIAKWILWVLAILAILANFGIDITSVLAGLGIAGIAVGLALQNILGDLFSSFAIFFDKPFQVGDFIVVGNSMGTVERIGIKTTRIRALQGEEIVISNNELTNSRIQNFRKLAERRIVFSFGILYETPTDTVANVPELVRKVVEDVDQTRMDRVHLQSFGDSALVFEVVYYVLSDDYNTYMDIQQNINLGLMRAFEKENITFAYPTQTIYVAKS